MKIVGIILLFVGIAATAGAQGRVPEVDANSAVNAVALVSGALLIIQSRRKK
jgi:hypothetical protein